jgi:hypothetical protein
MSNHIDFRKLRHALQVVIAKQSRIDQSFFQFFGDVEPWDRITNSSGPRLLKQESFVLDYVCRCFLDPGLAHSICCPSRQRRHQLIDRFLPGCLGYTHQHLVGHLGIIAFKVDAADYLLIRRPLIT